MVNLTEIDVDFETVMQELRRRRSHMTHGRLDLSMDFHAGLLIEHRWETGPETRGDVVWAMRAKPERRGQ
jgi:hypothetical protein